jgi:hypothetical protein
MVNRTLPWGGVDAGVLAETRLAMQGAIMTARMTLLAASMLLLGCGGAAAGCGGAIGEFESIITSDVNTGNLNKGVHRKIVTELGRVKASCAAGREAEATRGLAAVKARHGYR